VLTSDDFLNMIFAHILIILFKICT